MNRIAIYQDKKLVIMYFTDKSRYNTILRSLQESTFRKIDGQWSIRLDKGQPHIPTQDHIHVLQRGNNLLSINQDGTAHDNSYGRIPNKVRDYIEQNFKNFVVPPNGILESSGYENMKPRFKAFFYGASDLVEFCNYAGTRWMRISEYWIFEQTCSPQQ